MYRMSAAPLMTKRSASAAADQNAGGIARVLLRFTLMGCALALVGTLAHIAWKAMV
jgi:hypothetical protein